MLQLLNRTIPVLKHLRSSVYVHPERLYTALVSLAGELATFATPERRARLYPAYDHDKLEEVFDPVVRDLQDFLSARLGRRAIRLEIIERAQNAFISPIRDRTLFRTATLVLEVAARRPLTEIQTQFPNLFKIGPNTKMNDIVLDSFSGSGSTIMAGVKLKRRVYAVEIEPVFCDLTIRRFEHMTGIKATVIRANEAQ